MLLALPLMNCIMREWPKPDDRHQPAAKLSLNRQSSDIRRLRIAMLAEKLEGLPYLFGGTDIDGFDCSGFVAYIYSCFGIELPRRAEEQARLEKKIDLADALPGDILIFKLDSGWHSAIYLGKNLFVHAPKANECIRRESLTSFWLTRLVHAIAIL